MIERYNELIRDLAKAMEEISKPRIVVTSQSVNNNIIRCACGEMYDTNTVHTCISDKRIEDMEIGVPFVVANDIFGSELNAIRLNADRWCWECEEEWAKGWINGEMDPSIFTIVDWFEPEPTNLTKLCSHGQEGWCRQGCKG